MTTPTHYNPAPRLRGAGHRRTSALLAAWFCALWAALCSTPLAARPVQGLYEVTVPIDAQSPAELRRASREGLAELFVRVSGHEAVLRDDAIVEAVHDAGSYTKQFTYLSSSDPETEEDRLEVALTFEPSLVENTLRRAGLPLWSPNRPTVLVWLALEDDQGRRFVSVEKDPQIVSAIEANARRRGLAIQLPSLDLQDLVALSPDDLWRDDVAKIEQAVERYGADTVLTGRVNQLSNDRWLGRWSYELDGRRLEFDGEADEIAVYVAAALDQVAETLAAEYAIIPVKMAEGGVIMRLTNVRSFVDYIRAVNYLEGVVAIHHANVVSIEADELILRLAADGELPQLQQAFSLDGQLQPWLGSAYDGPYPVVLTYRWPSEAPPLPEPPEAADPPPSELPPPAEEESLLDMEVSLHER